MEHFSHLRGKLTQCSIPEHCGAGHAQTAMLVAQSQDYRAVDNRCAVNLDALNIDIPKENVLEILKMQKFDSVDVDLVALARSCIETSRYKRGSRLSQAPKHFDCSSFVKWLYAERGIWLPRRSIQQSRSGVRVAVNEIIAGDIVLTSGAINYFIKNTKEGIGHVGIATNSHTVIHAANSQDDIVETDLDAFVAEGKFRDARRIIPLHDDVRTFITPHTREVETADDVKWIILQNRPGWKRPSGRDALDEDSNA